MMVTISDREMIETFIKMGGDHYKTQEAKKAALLQSVKSEPSTSGAPVGVIARTSGRSRRPVPRNRSVRFATLYQRSKVHPYDASVFRRSKSTQMDQQVSAKWWSKLAHIQTRRWTTLLMGRRDP